MSEVDEAVRGMSGTAATTLQLTMTMVEQQARRRAERLHRAAAESEQARQRARQVLKAEADAQAARWAALSHNDPDWVEGYATSVEWRELDPRAAAAADRTEDALRWAGVEAPDTSGIRNVSRDAAAAVGLDQQMTTAPGTPWPGEDLQRGIGEGGKEASWTTMAEEARTEGPVRGKIDVDVDVRPAKEVELGKRSHPHALDLNGSPRPGINGRRRGSAVRRDQQQHRERGR